MLSSCRVKVGAVLHTPSFLLPSSDLLVLMPLLSPHTSFPANQPPTTPHSITQSTNNQIASKALYDYSNQYPSLLGVPELRQAVARHSTSQQQLPCEWSTDTLITVGATEGIAAAFMGMINPGDEVRVEGVNESDGDE